MSYRITAFIIAAGLVTVFLATETDRTWTEDRSVYASSDVSHKLSESEKTDTTEVLKTRNETPDIIPTDSIQAESAHPDNILPMDEKSRPDIMVHPQFARVAFSHRCLKVVRDGEELEIPENEELLPGDVIETCHRHFALIDFSPAGTMILYPASRVTILPDASELIVNSAEVLFENDLPETSFPGVIRCFDEALHHSHDAPPVSFGVHCRGESGMILTSKTGTLRWSCRDAPCEILAGQGLMGRITTANYSKVMPPAQPHIRNAYVIPQLQTKDREGEPEPAVERDPDPDQKSRFSTTIMWDRVEMADQYLVHVYQDTEEEERYHHALTLHHKNRFKVELPEPGRYTVRVMAVDYYGVSGEWSAPFSFTAEHYELVGEDSLDAFSPGSMPDPSRKHSLPFQETSPADHCNMPGPSGKLAQSITETYRLGAPCCGGRHEVLPGGIL